MVSSNLSNHARRLAPASPLSLRNMNIPKTGTCVRASTQLSSNDKAMTTKSGLTISATDEGAR